MASQLHVHPSLPFSAAMEHISALPQVRCQALPVEGARGWWYKMGFPSSAAAGLLLLPGFVSCVCVWWDRGWGASHGTQFKLCAQSTLPFWRCPAPALAWRPPTWTSCTSDLLVPCWWVWATRQGTLCAFASASVTSFSSAGLLQSVISAVLTSRSSLVFSIPVPSWFTLSSAVSACNGSAFSSSGSPQGHGFPLHWAPTGKASSSSFPWCLEGRFSASPTYEALRNSPPPREPWFSPSQRRQHFSPGEEGPSEGTHYNLKDTGCSIYLFLLVLKYSL